MAVRHFNELKLRSSEEMKTDRAYLEQLGSSDALGSSSKRVRRSAIRRRN